MNPFYAVLLGLVQGLTEFLPISSTAHLTLTGKILGLIDANHPEAWTAFIAVMQLGTVMAVIGYFFKEVSEMFKSLIQDIRAKGLNANLQVYSHTSYLAICILIGTVPVVVAGFFLAALIEGSFTKGTLLIAASLSGLAIVLWVAERVARHARSLESASVWDALFVGFAQALALIPGSSRSGVTITAGLFLGFTRETAARFSFLLSIPAVLLSGAYEMTKIHASVFELGIGNLLLATVVSGISGYAAIHWLLKFLQRHSTLLFIIYRIGLAVLVTVLLSLGILRH
jgi:undecaprenyl-diphosphatase